MPFKDGPHHNISDISQLLMSRLTSVPGVPDLPPTNPHTHPADQIGDHSEFGRTGRATLQLPSTISEAVHVEGRVADAALRHISSALTRLSDDGRLVAITGANLGPDAPLCRPSTRVALR